MRFILGVILSLSFGLNLIAQHSATEFIVVNTIDSLDNTQNSKSFTYIDYSVGYIRFKTSSVCNKCNPDNTMFNFSIKNDKIFIKKIDSCGEFFETEIDNQLIKEILLSDFENLFEEKIKSYQISENIFSTISHSKFKGLYFKSENNSFYKYFDTYDISTKEGKESNVNYEFNNSLEIVKLTKEIENLIISTYFERDNSKCIK